MQGKYELGLKNKPFLTLRDKQRFLSRTLTCSRQKLYKTVRQGEQLSGTTQASTHHELHRPLRTSPPSPSSLKVGIARLPDSSGQGQALERRLTTDVIHQSFKTCVDQLDCCGESQIGLDLRSGSQCTKTTPVCSLKIQRRASQLMSEHRLLPPIELIPSTFKSTLDGLEGTAADWSPSILGSIPGIRIFILVLCRLR